MTIHKHYDISTEIYDIIEREVDALVEDETTIAATYGYYKAYSDLILENIKRFGRTDAHQRMKSVCPIFYDTDESMLDDAPLFLLRDYLEDYVRARILPDERETACKVIESVLDDYDWCGIASDMACDFAPESDG